MNKLKVLFVSSEVAPFIKVGGLADVVGALPCTLAKQGCDARVILPLYRKIKQNMSGRLKSLGWRMVKMGWRSMYAGLFSLEHDGVTFYFVDNEYYFNFDQVYVEYSFDIERYCFFQRAVADFLGDFLGFEPDVLHCNDWQTGMLPLLLDVHFKPYGFHTDIKTVYTIHNLKYQGVHSAEVIKDLLDLPDRVMTEALILKDGAANFMKAGIVYSNSVTTVSPTYAYEIMTDYYGEGLNGTLQRFAYKVSGILNGIYEEEYNPISDSHIPVCYSYENQKEGKAACKAVVQRKLGLAVNPLAPLCVMVSRLVDQKGLDLLLRVLDEMLFDGMQIVILGTGDEYYENALSDIARKSPEKMCACISFDNDLAHTLYAGADIYLMPSIFEPCGLSQMIAMKYGTIPIVRETGGLKDTVFPFNEYTGSGNGFSFTNINAHEFLFVTKYACDLYRHHSETWQNLIRTAMMGDYSWDRSAKEYAGLYTFITGFGISQTPPSTEHEMIAVTEIIDADDEQKTATPKVSPKVASAKKKKVADSVASKKVSEVAAPPVASKKTSSKKVASAPVVTKKVAEAVPEKKAVSKTKAKDVQKDND